MADAVTDTPVAPAVVVKQGYKTSEFWMSVVAMVLSALFASGVIPTGGTADTVAGIVAALLGSMGYTVSRTLAKKA